MNHKILMAYDNCYFNGGCSCAICGIWYESGGIEFGLEIAANGKIEYGSAICPDCMKKANIGWKEILLKRANEQREYAKVAAGEALDRMAYLEAFANDSFLLPTEEEEMAIRAQFPGAWLLIEGMVSGGDLREMSLPR
jgi:hypothetical protein